MYSQLRCTPRGRKNILQEKIFYWLKCRFTFKKIFHEKQTSDGQNVNSKKTKNYPLIFHTITVESCNCKRFKRCVKNFICRKFTSLSVAYGTGATFILMNLPFFMNLSRLFEHTRGKLN